MARDIVLTLMLDEISIEEFKGLAFRILESNIDLLAQQPTLEVPSRYKKEDLDYEKGYRSIIVMVEPERPFRFSYAVIDSAHVIGSDHKLNQVGMRRYTQKEVDELRSLTD